MLRRQEVLSDNFQEKLQKALNNVQKNMVLLYELATVDEKTGLYNNKFFNNMLEMELEKGKRGERFCIVGIDIDFFKKINDTYGHLTGDKILEQLAKVLKKSLRKYDIPARFGGEEFFVILPKTKAKQAGLIAERIRKNIKLDKVMKKYEVSASFGVSEYRTRDGKKSIIVRADKALYEAKKKGRDRVIVSK